MSKYLQRGAYHYVEFNDKRSTYRAHVLDLVAKIEEHAEEEWDQVLEIGAGEGLILDQLEQKGFETHGCDIDPIAVSLAQERKNSVIKGTIEDYIGTQSDILLLCDVLEHVESPEFVLTHAREMASMIVIAIPDREDRHAVNKISPADVRASMEDSCWRRVHYETRHARHLLIFKKIEEQSTPEDAFTELAETS